LGKNQPEEEWNDDEELDNRDNNDLMGDDFEKNIDNLVKKQIDSKRVKKIDQTKKRATVDSVFDERMYLQISKILNAYGQNNKEYAVKIYKIDTNTSKWMRNYIIGDPRFKRIPHNVSKIIYLWASKEFKNLKRAYKVGLNVPEPLFIKNNILIMDYIGFASIPAPKLKDIKFPKDPINLLNEILYFIKNLYQKAALVHGDLSEFNILYHNQKPVIIDISQGVTTHHPKAEILLVRDIKNIFNYFETIGVEVPNREEFYYEVINLE